MFWNQNEASLLALGLTLIFLTSKGEIKKEFGSDLSREFIGQGVIHTFAYLEDVAVESLSALHYGHKYEVYECIIPKETFYYTGLAFGVPSYGSICIKFIKRVDVWLCNLYRWIL